MKGGRRTVPRSAVVLGATGHAGSAVVRALLARGARVTAATRRASPTPNLAGLDVTIAPGDADDPAQLERWTEGHDLVVDAAVPYPMWLFRPDSRAEMDPHAHAQARTDRVLAAARRHGATLGVIGSFTTLPHPGDAHGDLEPRMLRRSHPYFAVKDLVESRVLSAAKSGLSVVVVNPTAFLGPWDFKAKESAFLPVLLGGKAPMTTGRVVNFIDVRDVAAALVAAVWGGRFGEKIPLAGHDVAIDHLSQMACSMYGVRAPVLRGSTRVGAALGYLAEATWGAFGKRPPTPALTMLLVRYGYPMSQSPAQRELAPVERPLEETLRDAIAWYRSIGHV